MKKLIIPFIILATIVDSSQAQTTEGLLRFSQNNFGIATARSAAMGGAFTSLGADAISMSLNPAGIAMYKSSEISISPGIRFNSTTNDYSGYGSTTDRNNKFVTGNLAGVYSNGTFSIGVGYNRLADFYSNSTSYGSDQYISVTDMFAEQLLGIHQKEINTWSGMNSFPPSMWGAILAYQTGSVVPFKDYKDVYSSLLNPGDKLSPSLNRKTEGAIDEFTLSGGYNYNDFLYVGMTLSAQSIRYAKYDNYQESGVAGNTGLFDFMDYNRNLRISGSGFNFKLGATVRPVDWLRIGVSYHSPTWTVIHSEYDENMTSFAINDNNGYFQNTDIRANDYDIYTPSRLLAGISLTIARRVIVAFDYHRTWYQSMGYRQSIDEYLYHPEMTANVIDNYNSILQNMDRRGFIDLNPIVKNNYRATNTYSMGIEGQVARGFFLRAGYTYQDSPYSDKSLHEYGKVEQYAFGAGYRNNQFSVDLAYVNSRSKSLPYKYYSYSVQEEGTTYTYEPHGWNSARNIVENIILTVGIRF